MSRQRPQQQIIAARRNTRPDHALAGLRDVITQGLPGLAFQPRHQRQRGQQIACAMDVTIYAEALPPHTTSNIAGAVWGPSSLYRRDAVDETFAGRFVNAARVSQRAFQHFANDPRYGVYWLRQYDLSLREPSGEREAQPLDHLYPGLVRHTDPDRWFGYPSVTENHGEAPHYHWKTGD